MNVMNIIDNIKKKNKVLNFKFISTYFLRIKNRLEVEY